MFFFVFCRVGCGFKEVVLVNYYSEYGLYIEACWGSLGREF